MRDSVIIRIAISLGSYLLLEKNAKKIEICRWVSKLFQDINYLLNSKAYFGQDFKLKTHSLKIFCYICLHVGACAHVCMGRSEDNLRELVLPSHRVGPRMNLMADAEVFQLYYSLILSYYVQPICEIENMLEYMNAHSHSEHGMNI